MLRKSTVIFALLALAASWPAWAGDDKKEVTPFIGYRFGGNFENFTTGQNYDVDSSESYGLTFDFPVDDEVKLELLYSRQDTEIETSGYLGAERVPIDLEYYHVGAVYQPGLDDRLQPFVGGTLGATYMNPRGENLGSETRFSLSIGGGAKLFFSDHVGLRLEGRFYATFVNGGGSVFCSGGSGGGGCSFGFSGNALWQAEGNLGLIIGF